MSTNAQKLISSESSYVKVNSTRSSPDACDDDVTEFKANIIESERIRLRNITMGGISIPHHGLAAAIQSHGNSNANSVNHHLHYSPTGISKTSDFSANAQNHMTNNNYDSCKSPFLLPAQLYKSLFANAVLQNSEKMCSHPFPRNLLFSYAEKSPASSDFDAEDKNSLADEVSERRRCICDERCFFPFFHFHLIFLLLYFVHLQH